LRFTPARPTAKPEFRRPGVPDKPAVAASIAHRVTIP
jgi:hypothetical protein